MLVRTRLFWRSRVGGTAKAGGPTTADPGLSHAGLPRLHQTNLPGDGAGFTTSIRIPRVPSSTPVILAGRIRELGAGLMVGDDSLVGPSASIWQQLASGLGCSWVGATEKRRESDFYYRCVNDLATDSTHNPIFIQWKKGFGINLDEARLAREVDSTVEVKR